MPAKILHINDDNFWEVVEEAASFIRKGKIVALPTETVYGLAVDYNNKDAIARLCAVKRRPANKPFSVHIAQTRSFNILAASQKPFVYRLIERFWLILLSTMPKLSKSYVISSKIKKADI
jgi:L-threonylcarbamoyladenylate synthase